MNTTIMMRVFVYIAKYKKYMIISIFSAIVSVIGLEAIRWILFLSKGF